MNPVATTTPTTAKLDLPTSHDKPDDEVLETLTGYEEIDVEKRFGANVSELLRTKQTMYRRAMIYIVTVRQLRDAEVKGYSDKAYAHAMSLTLRQQVDFFPEDTEVNDEQPVTDSGKDGSDDES